MKILIGMKTFVLEQNIKHNGEYEGEEMVDLLVKLYGNTVKYANFLSRQPQLSDFVPCGSDGLPIEKPSEHLENRSLYYQELKAYQQALDKVLFKGWRVENIGTKTVWIESDKNESICFTDRGKVNYNGIDITSLESLTPYNLELTENANKIIGV